MKSAFSTVVSRMLRSFRSVFHSDKDEAS